MNYVYETDELYHHGVPGMKWGQHKNYSSAKAQRRLVKKYDKAVNNKTYYKLLKKHRAAAPKGQKVFNALYDIMPNKLIDHKIRKNTEKGKIFASQIDWSKVTYEDAIRSKFRLTMGIQGRGMSSTTYKGKNFTYNG